MPWCILDLICNEKLCPKIETFLVTENGIFTYFAELLGQDFSENFNLISCFYHLWVQKVIFQFISVYCHNVRISCILSICFSFFFGDDKVKETAPKIKTLFSKKTFSKVSYLLLSVGFLFGGPFFYKYPVLWVTSKKILYKKELSIST